MLEKEHVVAMVNKLPERFTIDELFERLRFLSHVQQGLNDIQEGRVFSETEARQRLNKWQK